MSYIKVTGALTALDTLDEKGREFDTTDIAIKYEDEGYYGNSLWVDKAYIGLLNRADTLHVENWLSTNIASDHIICSGKGNVHVDNAVMIDVLPYLYTDSNHKDLIQVYNYDTKKHCLRNTPVSNVYIGKLHATILGKDKFILHNTETCGYDNFTLFRNGVTVDSDNPDQFLINSINATNWVIGSVTNPIDPDLISNSIIRIMGVKPNSPPSHNITIHAYKGLRLQLDESAQNALKLFEY